MNTSQAVAAAKEQGQIKFNFWGTERVLVASPEGKQCVDGQVRNLWVGIPPDYLTVGDWFTEQEFAEFAVHDYNNGHIHFENAGDY